MNEGFVEVSGVTHSGKVLSRTYRPTADSKDRITQDFTSDYANFQNVITKSEMCAAILRVENDDPDQTKAEISRLKEIIADYEKSL
jgi:hypothetical protein